jgi:hypothetical protein
MRRVAANESLLPKGLVQGDAFVVQTDGACVDGGFR